MAPGKRLRPSKFKSLVYFLRGLLAISRHLIKNTSSYCVMGKPQPVFYGRRRFGDYKSFPENSSIKGVLSTEPYLRPTRYCNSSAPEVIDLAARIRSSSDSDWDCGRSIYDFVCNEILFQFVSSPPRGVVHTMERGFGICIDKLNLLVALARAGGIPARYCTVDRRTLARGPAHTIGRQVNMYNWLFADKMGFKMKVNDRKDLAMFMYFTTEVQHYFGRRVHPHAELKIDGLWIPADPTLDNDLAAGLNLPLPRFGFDPLMLWGHTGNIVARREDMTKRPRQWLRRRLFCAFTCGDDNCLNQAIENVRQRGRQLLTELGESEYVRRKEDYYIPVLGIAELVHEGARSKS